MNELGHGFVIRNLEPLDFVSALLKTFDLYLCEEVRIDENNGLVVDSVCK